MSSKLFRIIVSGFRGRFSVKLNWLKQMVNAITERNQNSPVLNSVHHLPKPWSDRSTRVNGRKALCPKACDIASSNRYLLLGTFRQRAVRGGCIRADKGWAVKQVRSIKKVWCSGLGSIHGPQIKETGNIKGISGKRVMSLKGFVNRFSHYWQIDIDRDASTVHCMSSSVFQLFNNRRNLGRTKNIDIERHNLYGLFYHEEHRSCNSLKSSREKKKIVSRAQPLSALVVSQAVRHIS